MDENGLLKDLQTICLNESDDYLNSFRETLVNLKTDPIRSIIDLQKIMHSMKGNFQAVAFLQFGEFVHRFESILGEIESTITNLGSLLDADEAALEFFLSNVLGAMTTYIQDLKESGADHQELLSKREGSLADLRTWAPHQVKEEPISAPAADPGFVADVPAATKADPPPAVELAMAAPPPPPEPVAESQPPSTPPADSQQPSAPEENANSSGLFLLVQNSQRYYGIAIEYIVEVIKSRPLSSTPHKRENISGLLNLRGEILPILNVKDIVSESSSESTYVVVSQIQDLRFGFEVEQVHQVIPMDRTQFQSVGELCSLENNDLISHFYQMDNKTVSILNLADLVAS